jgi:hypothetical protein
LGSVAAIGVAIVIAGHQHRSALRRDLERERRRREQTARQCLAFSTTLIEGVANMQLACQERDLSRAKREEARLREVADFGRAINVTEVPEDAVFAFLELRSLAAEVLVDADVTINRAWGGSLESVIKQLDFQWQSVGKWAKELHAALGTTPPGPE